MTLKSTREILEGKIRAHPFLFCMTTNLCKGEGDNQERENQRTQEVYTIKEAVQTREGALNQ